MTRHLGPFPVFPIGLGCMEISGRYGAISDDQARAVLHAALDAGVTLFDTSDRYGAGHSETLLGEAVRSVRDQVRICTKFGHVLGLDGEVVRDDGRPEYVHSACDASLRRLGVDVIDLYLQHRVDPDVPIEETVGAMAELLAAGKVRAIGLCEVRAATLERAHAIHPIDVVQSEYSLWYRGPEAELLPTCHRLGVGFLSYAPLGRGLLVDGVEAPPAGDRRRQHPRFQPGNLERNVVLTGRVADQARQLGCTTAQLGLAWLLARDPGVVPIPGTTSPQHVRENSAAADLDLAPADLARLDDLIPPGSGAGERYPTAGMANVDA